MLLMAKTSSEFDLTLKLNPAKIVNVMTRPLVTDRDFFSIRGLERGGAAVAIISHRRVFLAHIPERAIVDTPDNIFESDVVQPLLYGYPDAIGNIEQPGIMSYFDADFNGTGGNKNHLVIAYGPLSLSVRPPLTARMTNLKNRLEDILGVNKLDARMYGILPRDATSTQFENLLDARSFPDQYGVLLIQYTPWVNMGGRYTPPKAGFDVWVENDLSHKLLRTWKPLSQQKMSIERRQEIKDGNLKSMVAMQEFLDAKWMEEEMAKYNALEEPVMAYDEDEGSDRDAEGETDDEMEDPPQAQGKGKGRADN